jgi:TfoX/Sxy family transcriptional regulator of competence genes
MKGSRSGSGRVNKRCGRIKRKNMFMESNIFGNKNFFVDKSKSL